MGFPNFASERFLYSTYKYNTFFEYAETSHSFFQGYRILSVYLVLCRKCCNFVA